MIKYQKRRAGGISDRKLIRTEDAVGQVLCHDMTQIVKDKYKDARFRKGHVVTEADIPLLLSMGKEHLYPLVNSLRIAAISAVVVFFAGIAAAYYIAKFPRLVKGVLDVFLTLPLVLPPTVVGYLLLRVLGPKRLIGAWVLETFGIRLVMTWWSAIFATVVVVFPLIVPHSTRRV